MISKIPGRADLGDLKNWADNENLQLLNLTYVPEYHLRNSFLDPLILLCMKIILHI